MIAVGGIWTWALRESKLGSVAAWLPLPIVFLCGLRSLAIYSDILSMNAYIEERTEKHFLSEQGGWRNSCFRKNRRHLLSWSARIFWILLLALAVGVPLFLRDHAL